MFLKLKLERRRKTSEKIVRGEAVTRLTVERGKEEEREEGRRGRPNDHLGKSLLERAKLNLLSTWHCLQTAKGKVEIK